MSTSVKHLTVKRFGEKLRALRKQHNMTHVDLAAVLGYASSSQISFLETGKKKPTADLILKVSKLFSIPADVLLDDGLDLVGIFHVTKADKVG
jgi:transcriptional regulator with XRE-family HTH domain